MEPRRLTTLPSWLLSRASLRSHALLTAALAAAGVRGHHYRLLAALAELGPASQAALGRAASLDRRDVTTAVAELVERGAVTRSADAADRRSKTVALTDQGAVLLGELDEVMAGVQDELLAPLGEADRRRLVQLLRRIQ